VTSRARLTGLEGARIFALDVLRSDQAVELLGRIIGQSRVAAEPEAGRIIVEFCSGLPLAVRIAGARLLGRPHWRLARLAERLADAHRRLDELVVGDLEVRASVRLSYDGLPRRHGACSAGSPSSTLPTSPHGLVPLSWTSRCALPRTSSIACSTRNSFRSPDPLRVARPATGSMICFVCMRESGRGRKSQSLPGLPHWSGDSASGSPSLSTPTLCYSPAVRNVRARRSHRRLHWSQPRQASS
jgi:hypothetical protein